MRTVMLGGSLGARFGTDPFVLDVRSPQEAAIALGHLLQGFRQAVLDCAAGVHVIVGGEYRGEREVAQPCAGIETIEIVPAVAGSNAAARVVGGVVLFAVGAYFDQPGLMSMGAALALGGAAEMLSPKPKTSSSTSTTQSGYAFSGGVNTTGQGIAIRRAYGKGMSGTHIISSQILTEAGTFYAADELHKVVDGDEGSINTGGFSDTDVSWGNSDGESNCDGGSWGYDAGAGTATAPDGTSFGGDWGSVVAGGDWGGDNSGEDDSGDDSE